jgi:hypothetical protein
MTVVPSKFGGVSGGGLWSFELYNVDGRHEIRKKTLSGICFWETAMNDNIRYIKCYGWKSIYKTAYKAVVSKFA